MPSTLESSGITLNILVRSWFKARVLWSGHVRVPCLTTGKGLALSESQCSFLYIKKIKMGIRGGRGEEEGVHWGRFGKLQNEK